ncbi:ABC transporter ATP-binding protein [Plantibacter sp. Leaf171]|uniref:ABC transporter ATP-binding protein n=1 Tax=unclassified Plantibacter TaxID=2624265 RepID=UPI0006FE9497|nr:MULTISPECIES: ATP-binding cassette domain-containing protein [unclassified Plantibacter]KQM16140.1 ABC transporter ATP-binding protein [Plantibacter sp. Leaf1]KQQ52245.1 ABC transporter ATP-binding protein [Plantibacter sp. Leaf314]KQR59277.1 ABC transporter ATP-binding protein [Plantibacter sp. Leaf171]
MLELSHIDKSYGERKVLDDVSFQVAPGRMTGFVGGNGAGKTTTMRILLGVLTANAGTVTLDGTALTPEDRRRFGYMPEERGLYPKMRVEEQLVYLARLHGFTAHAAKRNAGELLERLGLGERRNDTLESLSLGNQQRAQIAAALVHDPEVLVLDEPFSGLDPMAVDVVVGVLSEVASGGAPVLFSSHQLDIVERLCDDLVIIASGTIRASGSRDTLREAHAGNRYELLTTADTGWLRERPGITVVDFDGGYALFDADDAAAAQAVLREALAHGDVTSFAPLRPTLAQIFKEVIQ